MSAAPALVPLAHAGHWLESIAFALPPLVLIGVLIGAALYARRHAGDSPDSEVTP
jgi:hypothetical protein